jgi:DNA-binding NarL/FixJ family response regulator
MAEGGSTTSRGHTASGILIAEGHPQLRAELRRRLSAAYPQVTISAAKDGLRAVALARVRRPDVVLIDVVLARLSGFEAIDRIRALLPNVKVVVLSLYDDAQFRARARKAGVEAYLAKAQPFDDVLVVLDRLLPAQKRRRRPAPQP